MTEVGRINIPVEVIGAGEAVRALGLTSGAYDKTAASIERSGLAASRFGKEMAAGALGANAAVLASTRSIEARMTAMGAAMTARGKALSMSLTLPIVAFGAVGVERLDAISKASMQTQRQLRITGDAAGVTAKGIAQIAMAERKTGVDRLQIQAGENMLLMFNNVRNVAGKNNDVFTRATHLSMDLAQKLGMDVPAAARILGKSLQEPATAMVMLSRVTGQLPPALKEQIKGLTDGIPPLKAFAVAGVDLSNKQETLFKKFSKTTDTMTALKKAHIDMTAAQTTMFTKMVEGGHIVEAQKLLLGNLEGRIGGLASRVPPLSKQLHLMKSDFEDAAASLTAGFMPQIEHAATGIDHFFVTLSHLSPGTKQLIVDAGLAAAALGPLALGIGAVSTVGGAALRGVRLLGAAYDSLALSAAAAAVAQEAEGAAATAAAEANVAAAAEIRAAAALGSTNIFPRAGAGVGGGFMPAALAGENAAAGGAGALGARGAAGGYGAMLAGGAGGVAGAEAATAGVEGLVAAETAATTGGAGLAAMLTGPVGIALGLTALAAVGGYEAYKHLAKGADMTAASIKDASDKSIIASGNFGRLQRVVNQGGGGALHRGIAHGPENTTRIAAGAQIADAASQVGIARLEAQLESVRQKADKAKGSFASWRADMVRMSTAPGIDHLDTSVKNVQRVIAAAHLQNAQDFNSGRESLKDYLKQETAINKEAGELAKHQAEVNKILKEQAALGKAAGSALIDAQVARGHALNVAGQGGPKPLSTTLGFNNSNVATNMFSAMAADAARAKPKVDAFTASLGHVKGKKVDVTASVFGNSSVQALNTTIGQVHSKTVTITAMINGTAALLSGQQPGKAVGGRIHGSGSDTSDSNLIRVSNDEYVIRAQAARRLGYGRLDYINRTGHLPGFKGGGKVKITPTDQADNAWQALQIRLALPEAQDHLALTRAGGNKKKQRIALRHLIHDYENEQEAEKNFLSSHPGKLTASTRTAVISARDSAFQNKQTFKQQLKDLNAKAATDDAFTKFSKGMAAMDAKDAFLVATGQMTAQQRLADQQSEYDSLSKLLPSLKGDELDQAYQTLAGLYDTLHPTVDKTAEEQAQLDHAQARADAAEANYNLSQSNLAALSSSGDIGQAQGSTALASGTTIIVNSLTGYDPRIQSAVSGVVNTGNATGASADKLYSGTGSTGI
jgi:hypothetical protein